MKPLTVKEITRLTGLSRETLRYYERVGLLDSPERGLNGYRLYREQDLERLEFIFKTKKAGFTIREIKELLELKDQGKATGRLGLEIAREHIAQIDRRLASLKEIRGILDHFATKCIEDGLDEPCSLSFHLEPVLFSENKE